MFSRIAGLTLACCLGMAPAAHAHLKDYLVNQDYYTAKRGEVEVALWNDMNFSEADNSDSYNSKHQVEVEFGVLDHLTLSYYEVYTWDREQDWERDEFKVEAKLRFAEAGKWPVDLALYTEYKNPDGHRDVRSDEVENKIILSRDFGPWNVVGNFVFEREINQHEEWKFEYTAGASYAVGARTRVGLEVKETLGNESEFGLRRDDHELYLVPGIYTSITPNMRLLVGPAFGLTEASDDLQLHSIIEYEF